MKPPPMLKTRLALLFAGAATLLVSGCASIAPVNVAFPEVRNEAARECVAWLSRAGQLASDNGVGDAGAYRVAGFPYLRVDRFSQSLRGRATEGPAFDAWVSRLIRLELDARSAEIGNLPSAARASLGPQPEAKAATCVLEVARDDLSSRERREALLANAVAPDNYAHWVRASGLYSIAKIPFAKGVEGWHAEADEMFRKTASGEAHQSNLVRYSPWDAVVSPQAVRETLARAPRDALGVPVFGPRETNQLFAAYAPYIEVETAGAHDRFGALGWDAGGQPEVDAAKPVLYRRLAYTQFRGKVLPQLVYTAWFSERPPTAPFDLLAGKLDGLVLRVTLDEAGRPLVYDTIHPCGCYHMFIPTALVNPVPAPDPGEEWALSPASLPAMDTAQRVTIRIASGSHHLVSVKPATGPAPQGAPYVFAEEDSLRRLPLRQGGTRSLYSPDGLVHASERLERAFFWPMGIESPGTMRQWGRHPTAFLGKRHFDDADLIDKRFAPAQ